MTCVLRTHTRSGRLCHVYFRCLYISSCTRTFHASSRFRHCLLRFRSSSLSTPRPRGLGPDYYYYDYYDITSGDESVKNPGSSYRHCSATASVALVLRSTYHQVVLRVIFRRYSFSSVRQFYASAIFRQFFSSVLHFFIASSFSIVSSSCVYNDRRTLQFVKLLPTGGKEAHSARSKSEFRCSPSKGLSIRRGVRLGASRGRRRLQVWRDSRHPPSRPIRLRLGSGRHP